MSLYLGLTACLPAAAAEDPRIASVTGIERQVDEKAVRKPQWATARLRDLLGLGDSLRTGPASRAEITHPDRSVLRLAERTTITLLDQPNRGFGLLLGKLWMRITKGTGGMRIHTAVAIATVTGTEFIIEVTGDNQTILTVVEGTVVLTSDKVSGEVTSVSVSGGQTVTVTPGMPLPAPRPVDVTRILESETVHREFITALETTPVTPEVPALGVDLSPAQAAVVNSLPLKVELLRLDPKAVKGSPLASPEDVAPVKVRVK